MTSQDPTDRQQLYESYVSDHFHGRSDQQFLATQLRYFHRNYRPHLPAQKEALIVDLGCGVGNFLHYLRHEQFTNMIGVDASRECIAAVKESHFSAVQQDIIPYLQQCDWAAALFTLNDVLEHHTRQEVLSILSLCHQKLGQGGAIIIKVPNMGNPLLGLHSRYIDITHEIGFTESSLRQALNMAGFSKVAILPSDIYVHDNLINIVAKCTAAVQNKLWQLQFKLYGRDQPVIFTKHLLAVARK